MLAVLEEGRTRGIGADKGGDNHDLFRLTSTMMLHTLDYSRFSSEWLCKKLQSLLLATCVVAWNVPGRRRMDRRSFGGGHCLPNLHRFVVSKVGLPSIWSLLAALIETMDCAYPAFRISLSRSNLCSVVNFPDCLNIVMKSLSCPCNSNFVLASYEHFISYLELMIHCLMYYIPPTPLSYLRSLTTP